MAEKQAVAEKEELVLCVERRPRTACSCWTSTDTRSMLPPLTLPPVSLGPAGTVAPLGFGTWAWGNKLLWGYDTSEDAALRAGFDRAMQPDGARASGVFWDTGDSYGTGTLEGRAESLLGEFRAASATPERAVVGTKLAIYPTRLTGAQFEEACRSSLRRMGREQVELVQAHWSAKRFQPWQEPAVWDGLARCHESGLARAVGTSNYGPEQLRRVNRFWRERGVPHVSNQAQFSLLSTLPLESGLFEACAEMGVVPIGYSPLALGLLSDKYGEGTLPPGPRGLLFKEILPGLRPLLGTLREAASARGKTVGQVALNWAMSRGALVIVGVRTAAQAEENLGALGWRLSGAEMDELERAAAKVPRKATQNIFNTE